jgi:hypothetical protein
VCFAALGCRGSSGPGSLPPAAPGASVRILTDRTEYRPTERVIVTTTNLTGRAVFDDHCGGEVQGFEYLQRWNASYGMGRGCLSRDPGGWRQRSVPIAAGGTHVDTMHINGQAYSGTWRVQLLLLDEAGEPLADAHRVSNTFRVRGGWTP